ncbi:MAG TPA: hypothetical protein VMZ53_29990 [Kofleriaceae bacterium]|nr:hypothetical protein [Kofleriaceae bacterium]
MATDNNGDGNGNGNGSASNGNGSASTGSRDLSGHFARTEDHRNSQFGRSQDDHEEHRRYEEERRRYEEARRRYDEAHQRYFTHRSNNSNSTGSNRSWVGGDERVDRPIADRNAEARNVERDHDRYAAGQATDRQIDRVTDARDRSPRFDTYRYDENVRSSEDRRRGFHPVQDRYYLDGKYRDDYHEPEHDRRDRFADTDDNPRNAWRSWSGRKFTDDRDHRDRNVGYDRPPLARDDRPRVRASYDERHGHPSVRAEIDYDQQWASRTERTDDNDASHMRGRDEDQDRSFIPRDEYGRRR